MATINGIYHPLKTDPFVPTGDSVGTGDLGRIAAAVGARLQALESSDQSLSVDVGTLEAVTAYLSTQDQAQVAQLTELAADVDALQVVTGQLDAATITSLQAALDDYQANQNATSAAINDALTAPNSQARASLDAEYSTHDQADVLKRPLASWGQAFTLAGGVAGSWDATTYDGWIAGIDTALGTSAVKADLGAGSDLRRVYSYTAGPTTGTPHALILGGTHPMEMASQHAAMRFFEKFATSTDPAIKALRSRLRITWVPTLTPSSYNVQRANANGVDVNRNGDYFWRFFDDTGNIGTKGATAMSEPETLIVKALLDTTKIACLIDCHMLGNTGPFLQFLPVSSWIVGDRRTAYSAVSQWNQRYNTGSVSVGEMGNGSDGTPFIHNWAARYLRFVKGRQNAYGVNLEARSDTAGMTGPTTTAEFIRLYAGMIHMHLAEWLLAGQTPPPSQPVSMQSRLTVERDGTSITAGGTRIDTQAATRLAWNEFRGATGSNLTTKLDVPIRCPGVLVVEARVHLQSVAGATAAVPVGVVLTQGLVPAAGGDVPFDYTVYDEPVVPVGQRATATLVYRAGYSNAAQIGDLIHRFQLGLSNVTPASQVRTRNMQLFATFYPDTEVNRVPIVPSTLP